MDFADGTFGLRATFKLISSMLTRSSLEDFYLLGIFSTVLKPRTPRRTWAVARFSP